MTNIILNEINNKCLTNQRWKISQTQPNNTNSFHIKGDGVEEKCP